MAADQPLPKLIDHLFRHHYGRMVAGLTRVFGPDALDLVEDVVQESMLRALKLWPFEGVPDRPEAWLTRVAQNLALDAVRHRRMAARKADELARWAERSAASGDTAGAGAGAGAGQEDIKDDTLRMIFTCCHPSLTAESRVALTLKTLCGFGVREIASALLSKETTVAQRLSRAKQSLQRKDVAFEVPAPSELAARLASVLEVVYLMFNEGYSAHAGDALVRRDLVHEAVRLAELLLEMPETAGPRVRALLALMLFLGARLPARTDAVGELLTLAHQDRALWDRQWIAMGFHHFERSIGGDELTPYHVEASIASLHAMAASYADTDWPKILARYDQLQALSPSPIVQLNRAVAVAKVHGIDKGLAELDALGEDRALRYYHLLPATRGQLLWARGECEPAAACFERALGLGCSEPERQFLRRRAAACRRGEPAPEF